MVRMSAILCRIPVVKFRKGGLARPAGPATSAAPAVVAAPAAAVSTAAAPAAAPAKAPAAGAKSKKKPLVMKDLAPLPKMDREKHYRRQPLTDEEIDYINNGGIKSK